MFRVLFLAFALLAAPALAHNYTLGDIKIGHIWAPQTTDKATLGAVYVSLLNTGKTEDVLTEVETPVAEKAQFHETTMENGVMKMRALKEVKLPPGQKVKLTPGGLHIMLFGLKEPLKDGARIPFTLRFAKAGEIMGEIYVQKAPATNDELEHNHN